MTIRVAARRLTLPVASSLPTTSSTFVYRTVGPTVQQRTKWIDSISGAWKSIRGKGAGSVAEAGGAELEDPKRRQEQLARSLQTSNTEGNIFQDEIETLKSAPEKEAAMSEVGARETEKTKENMAMVTDPDPRARARWQRKKVIQMVRRNGFITKEDRLKMTERQLRHKSDFLPTSVKKLVMLSRQISGKTVDDAITQMQWSKKKMAAEIKYYLEEARDLAIAQRGMGLGRVNGELLDKPRKIQTKEGKWVEITDPSRLYVAQSWVGRGEWRGKEIDYKGRGRMGVIQHPSTSITVVLKEEKTRIREYEEREARKQRRGPWVHLPNRRVYGQRPYYSW